MDHFENIKAWPFAEAKKLLEKINKIEDNEPVVFEEDKKNVHDLDHDKCKVDKKGSNKNNST